MQRDEKNKLYSSRHQRILQTNLICSPSLGNSSVLAFTSKLLSKSSAQGWQSLWVINFLPWSFCGEEVGSMNIRGWLVSLHLHHLVTLKGLLWEQPYTMGLCSSCWLLIWRSRQWGVWQEQNLKNFPQSKLHCCCQAALVLRGFLTPPKPIHNSLYSPWDFSQFSCNFLRSIILFLP